MYMRQPHIRELLTSIMMLKHKHRRRHRSSLHRESMSPTAPTIRVAAPVVEERPFRVVPILEKMGREFADDPLGDLKMRHFYNSDTPAAGVVRRAYEEARGTR
jgi:hypothetical protein